MRPRNGYGCRAIAIAAVVAAVAACSGGGDGAREATPDAADVYRARAALQPFKVELKGALLEGLEDGPQGAILVCKTAAPAIAARSSTGGVEMGRTSNKLRNPDNAPAGWMMPLLAEYENGGEEPHLAVVLEDGRIGYVEPIYVQKPCLMCHGSMIARSVSERIEAEYPDDKATGYEEGDFRGLFWVTVPPPSDQR